MNKEELIEIGQEKIDKAVDTFQSKAIDVLEFLTWQFKNDFATDIDNNLNGYKRDFDKLKIEYSKTYMENDRLKAENRQLKSELEELKKNAIVPKFKIGKTLFFITNIENQTIKSTKDWFYVLDNEGLFIETNNLPYNDCFYDYTFDRVFSTKQQAEEALRKVEEV